MSSQQGSVNGECEHDWVFISDWEGDPGVIGGTRSFHYYECSICGAQMEGDPPDYSEDY